MRGGERRVKGLDAKSSCISRELLGSHERDGPEPANVAVVECATVVELQRQGRIAPLVLGKIAGVDEERAGESRLNDKAVAAREIEYNELRPAPATLDRRAGRTPDQLGRRDVSQDIGPRDADPGYAHPCDLTIEVAGDGLGLRQLRHDRRRSTARARASRYRCGTACPRRRRAPRNRD